VSFLPAAFTTPFDNCQLVSQLFTDAISRRKDLPQVMGVIGRFVKLTTYTGVATVGAFFLWTRNSAVQPLSTSDYLFTSPTYRKLNPNQNAVLPDVCVRKVPLSQIDPKLLEQKGKLVEAFCAGVWGGIGVTETL
jgi:hypothetical protein